jgi:hypothetical protein
MIRKHRIAAIVLLTSLILTAAPIMFYAQGQIQTSSAQQLVSLADRAEEKVKNLIETVYANETAIQTITDLNLIDELEANVSLYNQGTTDLADAHIALEAENYQTAMTSATDAFQIFREVFRSIHVILRDAGLEVGQLVDSQGLLEALTRMRHRIDRLRTILPSDATPALALLDQAESYLDLDEARQLLLKGESNEVISNLGQARQLISQVYSYLKEQAEESNTWRINDYCLGIRERARERFRYGQEQGINLDSVLQQLGYQNETQFMQALQNMTQTAQGSSEDFQNAMQDLEAINQMFQQMNQAVDQEIMHRQGGNSGSGYGGSGSGAGAGNGGYGYGGG